MLRVTMNRSDFPWQGHLASLPELRGFRNRTRNGMSDLAVNLNMETVPTLL